MRVINICYLIVDWVGDVEMPVAVSQAKMLEALTADRVVQLQQVTNYQQVYRDAGICFIYRIDRDIIYF